jgi:hypothetical protein
MGGRDLAQICGRISLRQTEIHVQSGLVRRVVLILAGQKGVAARHVPQLRHGDDLPRRIHDLCSGLLIGQRCIVSGVDGRIVANLAARHENQERHECGDQ